MRLLRGQHGGEFGASDGRAHHHSRRVAHPGNDEREKRQEDICHGPDGGVAAVPDRDQTSQHPGRVDATEQRDRNACQRPAGRSAACHRDHQCEHKPDSAQVEREAFRPIDQQRNRGGRKPAGALQRLDALAATEVVDLARAQHPQHRQHRRQRPASHPDDADHERNGDRGHGDTLHQIFGRHQDAVTLPKRRSRR